LAAVPEARAAGAINAIIKSRDRMRTHGDLFIALFF